MKRPVISVSLWWLGGLGPIAWHWSLDKPLLQSNTTAPHTLSCSGSLLFNSQIVCTVKVAVWFLTPSDSLCVQSCIHGAAGVEVAYLLLHDWSCRFGLSTCLPLWPTPPPTKAAFSRSCQLAPGTDVTAMVSLRLFFFFFFKSLFLCSVDLKLSSNFLLEMALNC